MKTYLHRILLCIFMFVLGTALSSCKKSGSDGPPRPESLNVLVPTASGTSVYGNDIVSIDASNASEGYVMVQYSGSVSKIKLQITNPDGTIYTYAMTAGGYLTFPLSGGNGYYQLDVLENVDADLYALAFSQGIDVSVKDEFIPFLYPNQYVWFTADSAAIAKGEEISGESTTDLNYIENVYNFVTQNISYDNEKAANIATDYIPNIDDTLSSGKGICFDYASLMSAMLRSQGIPTKLVVGYSGPAYHAWISTYIEDVGWVDKIIEFDGQNWTLLDPTLAANNDSSAVSEYIGDGSNYTVKYSY